MSTSIAAASGTFKLGGDLEVNRLGYGTMQLTGDGVWGEPDDRDEAIAVLKRAVDAGVNFIDTADSYGPEVAERLIYEALHPYPDDLVIATKAGLTRSGPGDWRPVGRPEYLRQQCEMSLRRMGLETIDLFQLHRIDAKVPLEEQVGELAQPATGGEDPSHRPLRGRRLPARRRTEDGQNRLRPEPLQPHQPRRRAPPRPLHGEQHRLHPLVPPGDRQTPRGGRPPVPDRRRHRRRALPARPRLAPEALPRDAPDPRHLLGRPPRPKPRRRRARPDRRPVRGPGGRGLTATMRAMPWSARRFRKHRIT